MSPRVLLPLAEICSDAIEAAGSNRGIKEDQKGASPVRLGAQEPPRDLVVRRGKAVYGCAAAW